jgi:hypothetical protein
MSHPAPGELNTNGPLNWMAYDDRGYPGGNMIMLAMAITAVSTS